MNSVVKSGGGCREDEDETNGTDRNVENVKYPTDEVPIFLRPEFHDVFLGLVSMLNIRSFMKLAMTNKEMYKRCTEDKSINISFGGIDASVRKNGYNLPELHFRNDHRSDSFLVALRKLRCKKNMPSVDISKEMDDCSFIRSTGEYLKEIGVTTVRSLDITYHRSQKCAHHDSGVCESLLTFNKDFKVMYLCVSDSDDSLALPYIRTILQQNFLMEMSSKIPQVSFCGNENLSSDEFMELISKIHSGSYDQLSLTTGSVDWSSFEKLPFNHEGPLPDNRPLLFAKHRKECMDPIEYWLLDGNGCYTKCIDKGSSLRISKGEPRDSPFVRLKDEDIFKKLAEMRPMVYCNVRQFRSFTAGLAMIGQSYKGSLPAERPLCFKVSENRFWILDENDSLMSCTWDRGYAVWESPIPEKPLGHPVLTKYMFRKLIKDGRFFYLRVYCERSEEFASWFEELKTIDHHYDAPLPDERPVVLQKYPNDRVVFFEDHCVRCKWNGRTVDIKHCPIPDRPWILDAAEIVKILQSSLKGNVSVLGSCQFSAGIEEREFSIKYSELRVGLQVFRDGFDLFKTSSLDYFHPQRRVLVYSKTTKNSDDEIVEERFYASPSDFMKATWQKGRFSLSPANLCETSLEFLKQCFKLLAQKQYNIRLSLELDQFRSCLEQLKPVSFDYFGPLLNGDSPLVFMKNEGIHHTCSRFALRNLCPCSEPSKINAWILWDNKMATYCSWEAQKIPEVRFEMPSLPVDIPYALKSTVYLNILLKCKYEKEMVYRWFGSFDDFCFRLNDYKMMPPTYNGPLTYDCPLADWPKTLQARSRFVSSPPPSFCFLLREDRTVIKCTYEGSHIALFLPSPSDYLIPPALKSLL